MLQAAPGDTTSCCCRSTVRPSGHKLVTSGKRFNAPGDMARTPMLHYRIAPIKIFPAYNLLVKIRPAWITAGRGGFLPVNFLPGETLLAGDPIMGRLFYVDGNILIKEKHINSMIISPRAEFSWKYILM